MTMKVLATTLCLCLMAPRVLGHRFISDRCQPCTGSNPVQQQSGWTVRDQRNNCENIQEIVLQIRELNRTMSRDRYDMIINVFDGDDIARDRLNIETPAGLSWMEIVYNKLSFLHLNLKLIETHPRKYACSVNTVNMADRIPLCHVYTMMSRLSETEHFNDVCRKNGHVSGICPSFQLFAYRVLTTAAHTLNDVLSELTRYTTRHC